MAQTKPRWTFDATFDAPLTDVKKILFAIKEGKAGPEGPIFLHGDEPMEIRKVGRSYTLVSLQPDTPYKLHIDIDELSNRLILEGDQWYRGVYELTEADNKTTVQYKIYNRASGLKYWLVSFKTRSEKQHYRKAFNTLTARLRDALLHSGGG